MADTSISITAGAGTSVDTRTEATNGHHRQVVVIGDPATNAGVAPVDATAGLKVDLGVDNDITGTVTANLSATDNAVLDAIAASVDTIDSVDFATQTTLAEIKAKTDNIPAQGQALAAASLPVVLTAAQITTLTPPAAITGFATSAKQDTGNTSLATVAGAVSGTEMQVDVLTMPSTAVTNAGLTELAAAINASSQMDVNIAASAISFGGTSAADDADFTATTTAGTPAMGVYESTPTTVTDGDLGTVGITSGRRLKTSATIDAALPAGTNAIGKLAANSGVDIGDVTIDNASIAVTQSGTWDEVGINDSGNSITVDYATTGSGTATGALRVELPTNGTGVIATVGAVTAITNALPAGTNAIGKLAANSGVDIGDVDITSIAAGDNNIGNVDIASIAAGTNNIGDVDVLSVVPGTGATNLGKAIDTATGATDTGVLALATRDDALSALTPIEGDNVQLRTDSTGALWVKPSGTVTVDGSGVTQPVSGTVAVTNAGITTIAGAVSGTEMQVDVLTMPTVTVTATNLDVQSGGTDLATSAQGAAIQTAVEIIDNAISGSEMQVDVVGALPAGTNTLGAVKSVPSDIDINGSNANHADKYYTNAGAVTDGIVWSPAAGKRWHITTLYINVSAAATVTLEDDLAGGDVVRWKGELAATSGVVITYDKEHPFSSGEDAADLIITTTAGNVYVQAVGYEV